MCSKVQGFLNRASALRGIATLAVTMVLFGTFLSSCTKKVDDKDTTLNVVLIANIKGLDPARANDQYSSTGIQNIYEGLLQYHYLKRPYVLQPALAESMPTVTPDGLTYTFKIKKGVKFQDNPCFPEGKGRELTAEDFVYSFKRLADPNLASDGFWIFDGKIKGLNEWAANVKAKKADYSTAIDGLQAADKYTLVLKLTQPYYQLEYVLAMPFAVAVPKEAVDKYGAEFLNNPVGTGPYMLEKASDWVRGSKLTLKKNPNWRGETFPSEGEATDQANGLLADAGKPIPFAEKLVIHELPEDQPRWQNFMKGNLDFVVIPKDNFDTAMKDGKVAPDLAKKGMRIDISPAMEVTYFGFNMKDPLLGKNRDLRRAISLAVDTPTMIQRFQNGRALAAQGPIAPGLEAYDADFKNPWVQFNVAKAKEMLAKAGFPEGKGLPEFTYDALADSNTRQQAEFLVQSWAAIGLKVKISVNTWPQFQERIKSGQAQIFGIAWGYDYPDSQNVLQLFYSKNMSPGPNDTSYSNPEFDKLYEQSLTMAPGKERTEIYKKMRDLVVDDGPWAYSMHRLYYRMVHGWVNNFKWHEMDNGDFKYYRIDPKKRAELKAKL